MGRLRWSIASSYLPFLVNTAYTSEIPADSPHDHAHGLLKRTGNASSGADRTKPSLSTPTWTVAATGAGTSYAQACDSESAVYDTILSYGITPTGDDSPPSSTFAPTTSYTANTTRLCDGRVRVVGSLTPVHIGSALTDAFPTITYTGPAPSCSVQASDCSWLRKSYLSADSSYSASLSKYPDAPPGNPPNVPRCYIPGPPLDACGQCTIHGGNVELLYFPISTKTSRDMCATAPTSPVVCPYGRTHANNDTVKGYASAPCQYISTQHTSTTDSGPSTIVNGTTLYSNRAYISYDTLYATNSCGRVGGTYSNGLVTVASSDVYSLSGYHFMINHAAYSFNFADLMGPVPASAYLGQANCDDSGSPLGDGDVLNGVPGGGLGFCSTIIDEAYKPRLAAPPQLRGIDPQFQDCLLGLDGLYDPPHLMTSESTLDLPEATGTPGAKPQQGASVASALASPTALPESLDGHSGSTDAPGAPKPASGSPYSPNQGGDSPVASMKTLEPAQGQSQGTSPSDASNKDPEPAQGQSQGTSAPDASRESPEASNEDPDPSQDQAQGTSPSDASKQNPAASIKTPEASQGQAQGTGTSPSDASKEEPGSPHSSNVGAESSEQPTAYMESQTPRLTTPGASSAATEAAGSQSSDSPSSTSLASGPVFPADLYIIMSSCVMLGYLVW